MVVTAGIALEASAVAVNNAVIVAAGAVESAEAGSEALLVGQPCQLLLKWTMKRISQLWANPMR